MPTIVALVGHGVLRARLRSGLGRRYHLTVVEDAPDLWRAVRAHPVALVVVEARGDAPADAPATIAAFRAEYPAVAIAAYCALGPGVAGAILDLARAGAHEIIVAGLDDERAALEAAAEQALRRSVFDDVLAHLAPHEPHNPIVRATVRLFVHSASHPVTIPRAAALLGVHRRTLVDRCATAGLPAPRTLAVWGRLLLAARLLDFPALTVEHVAHTLEFPSANALGNLFRRHAGVSPAGLRTRGGYAWLRDRFVVRVTVPVAAARGSGR